MKPFVLSDIPSRPSRVVVEAEEAEEAELTFHPSLPVGSRDRNSTGIHTSGVGLSGVGGGQKSRGVKGQ